MSTYKKDTQFYHITGPGLIEGKYGKPNQFFYTDSFFSLGSDSPEVVDGKVSAQSQYIGNSIFTIPVEVTGPDEVIAAVYNITAPSTPFILFHLTDSGGRVITAGLVGGALGAAEVALAFGTLGGSTAAGVGVKAGVKTAQAAVVSFAKKLATWSLKSAGKELAARKAATILLGQATKGALRAASRGQIIEAATKLVGKGAAGLGEAQLAKVFRASKILTGGGSIATIFAGVTAGAVALSLIPGYIGYEVYMAIINNFAKFLNPYLIRKTYTDVQKTGGAATKRLDDGTIPKDPPAKHAMPWYSISISPTKKSTSFLNKNGGVVKVDPSVDERRNASTGAVRIGDSAVNISEIYLDFYKPIDFVTIVEMIQMLDVQNPLRNPFVKHKANIESFIVAESLNPILVALKKTAQYQTLLELNKFLDKNSEPSAAVKEAIRKGETPPNENLSGWGNIEKIKLFTQRAIESEKDDEANQFQIADLINQQLALIAEIDEVEKFRDRLKRDIDKIFIDGSINDNIRKGTNFGAFCSHYFDIFHTLAGGWPGSGKTSNSVKKRNERLKKALLVATPNAAKQADIREAQLAGQKILSIPFKQTANFERHADYNTAISILDEMRDESSGAFADKKRDVENYTNPAPKVTDDEREFIKTLAGYTPQQRKQLKEELTKRQEENKKKIGKTLQDIKRLTSSPSFMLASLMTGVSSPFPIKTVFGVIELPEINLESVTDIIKNSLNTQIDMTKNQVLNAIEDVAATAVDVVSASQYSPIGSLFGGNGERPPSVDFIKMKQNTYSQNISQQLDDIKKIITKPQEQVSLVRTHQQDSIETLKKYKDLCEDVQNLQVENVKIEKHIKAIDESELYNTKKTNYNELQTGITKKKNAITSAKDKARDGKSKTQGEILDQSKQSSNTVVNKTTQGSSKSNTVQKPELIVSDQISILDNKYQIDPKNQGVSNA